ncbi:hypothetical protein MMC07_007299 [Pseudocyphellaria aurata]|nr:hypothetical protein [Pseudocyphellaria aurata]
MPSRTNQIWTARSDSGSDSGYSDLSDHTESTAPTVYSRRPSLKHCETAALPYIGNPWAEPGEDDVDPRASVETFASTVASEEDFDEDLDPFDVPEYGNQSLGKISAVPSTPPDFAEFFPSTRRLNIKHDDATLDGNMNLRVDTEIRGSEGRRVDLTLFHLRMHDLKNREFSLRRYCRDSGRERSMSNALSTFRSKSENKTMTTSSLKRSDSGYESFSDEEMNTETSQSSQSHGTLPLPTNTTRLEFSNYAHVDVKRRGAKSSKRYEYEYWGTNYAWKRTATRTGSFREVSFHLIDTKTSHTIAHIVPAALTLAESREEEAKGGWVPPCSLWISDERAVNGFWPDVADAIVATGLIALVDDCINRRWRSKNSVHLTLPTLMKSPLKMNMEYVGPKRLLDEVFNRRGSTATRQPSPLRQSAIDSY